MAEVDNAGHFLSRWAKSLADYPLATLGLMWQEAMAVDCPVVSANSGGIPDILTDGVKGFLFDPKDEEGAINATRQLQPFCHQILAESSLNPRYRW